MRLCIDKSLLCVSCGLLVAAWTAQTTNAEEFFLQKVASDTALVRSVLTDTCGGAVPGKCEARGARCVDNRCACVDERHPFRLHSLHTVCWPEAKLGARCYFQASSRLAVMKRLPTITPKNLTLNESEDVLTLTCTEQCATTFSDCVVPMGWCACRPGYGRSEDASRCEPRPSGGLRARCGKHADCAALNARCVYSHCECGMGMVALNGGSGPCVNATRAPEAAPTVINRIPPAVSPQTALQQQAQLAPEVPSFGRPHKYIRDAPIAVE
ncbi:hypothetical protein IscW_ISCW008789 [Ixodes scapularis]|uniref:EB domain-containing protein n=1 Tax=Ixodes scapularis TaxID=6945 RepID=B7Q2I8_IXOSC|nr:hypothetical protein IscW_ISCW008789 [Ixodes scapularis]|eukprot:XP_002410840.1 hypothetical protein IscW_ISCW008789 [Ixodes scapularis]